jgi:sarcosine oxidase, subunit beta
MKNNISDIDNTYDVIIIGAGSIGTPSSFYLAKDKYKVLVIDANKSVGQGSNKTAIGGIRATHSDLAKIFLCSRSIEIFSSWKENYGNDIEWVPGGYVFTAYRDQDEKTLKELMTIQKGYGLEIDWLNANELQKIVPDLNPNGLLGGTYSSKDGNASPLLANHAFYEQAKKIGSAFLFNTFVKDLIIDHGSIKGVVTNQGSFYAPIVINAAGASAGEIGKMAGIHLPIMPDSHEAGITEPVSRFLNPMIVDMRPFGKSSNFYFYQHYTGQIVFCLTPLPNIWGLDTRETSEFLPLVARRLIEILPKLQNIRVRRTWRGLYPMTPDGFPIIGFIPEVNGFLQAAGMCGQGFMLGPAVAELIVRVVNNHLTKKDLIVLNELSPQRQFFSEEILK